MQLIWWVAGARAADPVPNEDLPDVGRPAPGPVAVPTAPAAPAASDSGLAPFAVARCPDITRTLPAELGAVLDAVVVVRVGDGSGSGWFASQDGFVWTAAHVVDGAGPVQVTLRNGLTLPATIVRTDAVADAALLHVSGAGFTCLPWSPPPPLGSELYAIGSPLGVGLEFTVTRGILSGDRTIDVQGVPVRLIQTDAPVNEGNSGGPLVTSDGRGVGVVSRKVVAAAVEGIGFAVSSDTLTQRLGITAADASDPLPTAGVAQVSPPSPRPTTGFDPAAYEPSVARLYGPIPKGRLQAGGVSAGLGWTTVLVTSLVYVAGIDPSPSQWRALQVVNGAGWVAGAAGTGLLVSASLGER